MANLATGAYFKIASDGWFKQGCWNPDSSKVISCEHFAQPLKGALGITDAATGAHVVGLHFDWHENPCGLSLDWIEGGKTVAVLLGEKHALQILLRATVNLIWRRK